MSKFGKLIDVEVPVLLEFYALQNKQSIAMTTVLREVAATVGDKAKVIKIDVDKNKELAQALRIKAIPTLIMYDKGEMVWRQSGDQDASTLLGIMNEYM